MSRPTAIKPWRSWKTWLAANPDKAQNLAACAQKRVTEWRAKLATRERRRDERMYGKGGLVSVLERNQRVEAAAKRLENLNCNEPMNDVGASGGLGGGLLTLLEWRDVAGQPNSHEESSECLREVLDVR